MFNVQCSIVCSAMSTASQTGLDKTVKKLKQNRAEVDVKKCVFRRRFMSQYSQSFTEFTEATSASQALTA